MTSKKIMRRPALAGSGRRLSREELDDLEAFFRGETASAWVLLLPEYEQCTAEVAERWRAWAADHPKAPMPDALARYLAG